MHYKAMFLDIDDTLIGASKQISPGNLAAIRRAQEAGYYITIATGRGYRGSALIWRELNIQGPMIVYGGACMMDTRTDEVLFTADIEPALIKEALLFAGECGLTAQIYQKDTVICKAENETTDRYVHALNLPLEIAPDIASRDWDNVPKVLVFAPVEREAEFVKLFSEKFKGRMEAASSKPGFIELNRVGCHKGSAMLRLADMLGFTRDEIIAVGDNTLDLQMIQMAGLGVCVANGQQVVKDIADVVAPGCDEDGVKWVIDTYFFNGQEDLPWKQR